MYLRTEKHNKHKIYTNKRNKCSFQIKYNACDVEDLQDIIKYCTFEGVSSRFFWI